MPDTIEDSEFGQVRIRRNVHAKHIRLRVRSDGTLSLTMPRRAALRTARQLVDEHRSSIRSALAGQTLGPKTEIDKKLLRKRAAAYLPRRLGWLASLHGFHYQNVRLSSAETRWGSCSSSGTISLNIWLMSLPLELVDYVIIHELAHTRQMNHSKEFWSTVETVLPDYKMLRRRLKQESLRP